ncbi:MAG: hypothetical protein LBT41_04985 [Candidatus Methanoplasma sp.]|jgi:hypothetical protein|nr:hypothetical protein [Candidatus Methanoplasma sp.]
MNTNETIQELGTFETPVIGITLFAGMPHAVLIFHEGMLISAILGEGAAGGRPIRYGKDKGTTTIQAPPGMTAEVRKYVRSADAVRDFRMYRDTETVCEVLRLRQA